MSDRLVWFFDLDDTLHDATTAAFPFNRPAMAAYMATHLGLDEEASHALRQRYWKRYGATLLGLVRHHEVRPAHFLEETHRLPGLEERLRTHPHDRAAVRRLPGRKYILTNAPRAYAKRVMDFLGLSTIFDGVICIEDMFGFGHLRPKPDARMFRQLLARMKLRPEQCVLVEDTLDNVRTAKGLGMKTVWMRRWMGHSKVSGRPAYVDRRVGSLARVGTYFPR